MLVSDIPPRFALISDSGDVAHVAELTGLDLSKYPSLFVDYSGGDVGDIYGCTKVAPWLSDRVYDVRAMSFPWDGLKQGGLGI